MKILAGATEQSPAITRITAAIFKFFMIEPPSKNGTAEKHCSKRDTAESSNISSSNF
jgi:hypothetical protein